VQTTQLLTPSLDQQWAAWQARDVLADQSVRLKLAIAVPIALVIGGATLYLVLAR
jgi:hypothetical protein